MWSTTCTMGIHTKNMTLVMSFFALLVLLGGCGQGSSSAGGDWHWTPPARLQAGNSGSTGAVIASPVQADAQYFVYAQGQAPEFDRRDDSLNIASYDPTAGYLGFPEQQRSSIDDYRSYYISTSPNRIVYPSDRLNNRRNNKHYHRPYQNRRPTNNRPRW